MIYKIIITKSRKKIFHLPADSSSFVWFSDRKFASILIKQNPENNNFASEIFRKARRNSSEGEKLQNRTNPEIINETIEHSLY